MAIEIKGGGLLFRWGNPEAYRQGDIDDLRMFGSHGHNWIKEGLPNAGKILFFNNGVERPGEDFFSTIELLDPMIDNESNYIIENSQFAINSTEVVYGNADTELFGSTFQSNAQQLNSGGFLINSFGERRLFEINNDNEIIWEIKTNLGFESFLYPADFTGFDNFIPEIEIESGFIDGPMEVCLNPSIPIELSATTESDSIIWSTGDTTSIITISEGGSFYFDAFNYCSGEFLRSDSITVSEIEIDKPDPLTEIASPGAQVFLRFFPPFPYTVVWFDSPDNPNYFLNESLLFIDNIQSDTTFWVAYNSPQGCHSERVEVNLSLIHI